MSKAGLRTKHPQNLVQGFKICTDILLIQAIILNLIQIRIIPPIIEYLQTIAITEIETYIL